MKIDILLIIAWVKFKSKSRFAQMERNRSYNGDMSHPIFCF